jgi:hypothetical protein
MEFIKKNAKDFTIAWIHREAKTLLEYSNSGNRQSIQWLFVLGGSLQINYTKNGYDGSYNMITNVLADLRPIKGLDTTWITPEGQCHCVAFMSADETNEYDAELINVTDSKTIEEADKEQLFVPIIPGVSINGVAVTQSSFIRIPANKQITISADHPGSPILVFTPVNG